MTKNKKIESFQDFIKRGGKVTKLKKAKKKISKKLQKQIKKAKTIKRNAFKKEIISFAKNLEINLPSSEIWFRKLYESHYKHLDDQYNQVFKKRYIPDVINYKLKYIIEIDGSIHNTLEQQTKDKIKDSFYKSKGFQVFRIKAYNNNSYIQCIESLILIRKDKPFESFFNFKLDSD